MYPRIYVYSRIHSSLMFYLFIFFYTQDTQGTQDVSQDVYSFWDTQLLCFTCSFFYTQDIRCILGCMFIQGYITLLCFICSFFSRCFIKVMYNIIQQYIYICFTKQSFYKHINNNEHNILLSFLMPRIRYFLYILC